MGEVRNSIDEAFEKWLARVAPDCADDPVVRLMLARAYIAGWSEGYDDGCLATCRAYDMSSAGINALRAQWGKEPLQ